MKQRPLRNGRTAFQIMAAMMAFFLVLAAAAPAGAWFSRKSRASAHQEKPFTKKQARSFAHKLIRGLFKRDVFVKDELAMRVQIGLIPVDVRHKEMTDREFTDMVLNATSDFSEVIVTNQEPSMSVKDLDQKLLSYDDEWTSRKRGVMLGADYLIIGSVSERTLSDERGRAYMAYDGKLYLKDIRKGRVLAEYGETYHKKKMKRKR